MVLTRRARRARMLITLWLPNEVLNKIIENAPQADRATLCRVSKLFHALALPVLDRSIVLLDETKLDTFSRVMIENPQRAGVVRSLTFSHRSSDDSGYGSLVEAMKLMTRLEHLYLGENAAHSVLFHRFELARLAFANLSQCHIFLPLSVSWNELLARFLDRHPNLTHFSLDCWRGSSPQLPKQGRNLLPNLRHYHGDSWFLPAFSTRNLQAARIFSIGGHDAKGITTLNSLSNPNVPFTLSVDYWTEIELREVLTLLSEHMPHLSNLQLRRRDFHIRECYIMPDINDIAAHLMHFVRLEHLALVHYEDCKVDHNNAAMGEQIFRTWVDAAPTMRGFCIGSKAWRKVHEKWKECPRIEFEKEAGFSALDDLECVDGPNFVG